MTGEIPIICSENLDLTKTNFKQEWRWVINTKGLILKYCDLNDNDRLFTIYCPEEGKITAMSKGIRSHKHKDFAALQQFCYSELTIDNSRGLGYINSAQIINNFYDMRTSVEKVSFASYFTDLVSSLSDELIYDEEFFKFILNSLFMVANSHKKPDMLTELFRLKSIFELKLLAVSGYMLQVSECENCHTAKDLTHFDVFSGSAVCSDCDEKGYGSQLVEVDSSVLGVIDFINQSDYRGVFSFSAKARCIRTVNEISERCLINKTEIYSDKLRYIKDLISPEE